MLTPHWGIVEIMCSLQAGHMSSDFKIISNSALEETSVSFEQFSFSNIGQIILDFEIKFLKNFNNLKKILLMFF